MNLSECDYELAKQDATIRELQAELEKTKAALAESKRNKVCRKNLVQQLQKENADFRITIQALINLHKEPKMNDLELQEFTNLRERRPELFSLILQMVTTSNAKGQDYGGKDTYSNLRASEAFGIPSWKGVLIRLQDKFSRVKSFAEHNFLAVKDESFEDTLMDMAVYSLLCIIMFRENKS